MEKSKANKLDVEFCQKWVDLLHRMVRQIIHINGAQLKQATDLRSEANKTTIHNKRVELLH